MNITLERFARDYLKDLLRYFNDGNQTRFKEKYYPKNTEEYIF